MYDRYAVAVEADAIAHAAPPSEATHSAQLVDVRRAATYAEATAQLAGATWKDPAKLAHWSAELDRSKSVIVYCFHGLDIGRSAALWLRSRGFDARYVAGGIEACRAAGVPLVPKV